MTLARGLGVMNETDCMATRADTPRANAAPLMTMVG
jgi:hypothetical protein